MGDSFQSELHQTLKTGGYSLDQVFNADETGLWWKLMPSKSLVHCGEKQANNFKQSKDRVTLLGCCNASGTCKLPLAFIHKSARPRCFKNMEMSALPVCYLSQPKAWMNATLFEGWFHKNFVPHVKTFCQDQGIECFCFSIMHQLIHHLKSLPPVMARLQLCFCLPIQPPSCNHWIKDFLKP